MMNKTTIARLIGAIAVAAFVAGCSDGELKLGGGADISPPAPIVIKFEANPPQVQKGGSTTLFWEVEEADSLEIAAAPEGLFQFHAGPFEELSGSTTVDGITDTTDFILTASKTVMVATPSENTIDSEPAAFVIHKAGQIPLPGEPPMPALNPQTVTSQATITVVVVADSECSIDIVSDAGEAPINAGTPTTIRWTATPDTAQVTVNSSDGTPVAETFPVNGSATVTPTSTTTYTASAVCPDGQEKTDTVTVQVNAADIQASIMVNGMKNATVQNLTDAVEVTWTVTPANAKVTVTASPAATCEPALPAAVESASGTASCTLTGTTSFQIRAEIGESSDVDDASATLIAGSTNLDIKADPWAFVSEEVEIEVKADAETVSGIQSLTVGGKTVETSALIAGAKVKTRVPDLSGVPIVIQRVGIAAPETQHPIQNIVPLEGHLFFHGGVGNPLPVTRVAFDPQDKKTFYYGVQREGFGEISMYRLSNFENSKEFSIGIEDPLKAAFNLSGLWINNDFFADQVKTYPVGAVTVREGDSQWVFAATTGIIMYSDDAGSTWKKLDVLYYARGDSYSGSHPTCAGKTQTGRTGANERGDIVAMGQVCDMIAKSDGKLIVAYDRGVVATSNVESYISDPRSAPWYGIPRNADSAAGLIFGTVAHDLEEANGKIYAATNKGIYVNQAGDGKVWEAFSGGSIDETKPVYALSFDSKSEKMFAGSDDGVYVTEIASASWTKTTGSVSGPVLSIAVDPAYNQDVTGPVVIAGTANGIAVTRNGGESWSVLNSEVATDLGEVRSLAIAATVSGSEVTYKISAGGNGYAAGIVKVGATVTPDSSSSFTAATRHFAAPMVAR